MVVCRIQFFLGQNWECLGADFLYRNTVNTTFSHSSVFLIVFSLLFFPPVFSSLLSLHTFPCCLTFPHHRGELCKLELNPLKVSSQFKSKCPFIQPRSPESWRFFLFCPVEGCNFKLKIKVSYQKDKEREQCEHTCIFSNFCNRIQKIK